MITTLLGKKLSMTQLWDDEGMSHAVTIIEAGPCQVVQVKKKDGKDGYDAVQIGFDPAPARNKGAGTPRLSKPLVGHFKKHQASTHRLLREVPAAPKANPEPGATVKVDIFKAGEKVDVVGTTKGRGFQGCVKRHKFAIKFGTHGSKNVREPGAIGNNQTPGHVIKGKRLPGQFGNAQRTTRNLKVVKVEPEHNLIYVEGAVPGPRGGYVMVRKAVRP